MSITVLNPGLMTSIQDMGRFGYQQFGVSVSGVMDPRAAAIANVLVGNPTDEAVLECTMLGPHLRFDCSNCIAITGGDLGAELDGQAIPTYQAIHVAEGQVLRFTGPKSGCRAFLAFSGGLDIPIVMGSRSTDIRAKIGGIQGRKLNEGDTIGFRAPVTTLRNWGLRAIAPEFIPRDEYDVRVILGPQDDAFTPDGLDTFLNEIYTVTAEFDRMGCRLDGPVIQHDTSADIISDGISFGAIQIPASGKPIIMLSDCQTTGGYTKIGTVISADFRILAQLKAGDKLRFRAVPIEVAQEALICQRATIQLLCHAFDFM